MMHRAKAYAAVGFLLIGIALRASAFPVFERAPCPVQISAEPLGLGAQWRNAPPWMQEGQVSAVPQPCEDSPSPTWSPWLSRPPGAPQVVLPRPHPPPPFWLRITLDRRRVHVHPRSESWTAVQIATPIAAALTVAALAAVFFYCYRQRRYARNSSGLSADMSRPLRGPPSTQPGAVRARLKTPSLLYGLFPGTRSARSRDRMRDPDWQIEDSDDVNGNGEGAWLRTAGHAHQPSASSSLSTVPLSIATSPYFQPQVEDDETEEQDHGYFPVPTHGRNASAASDSALLLRPERRGHPRSLWDRIVKYTDGLRKSPSYRSGRVRPLRAAPRSTLNLDDVPADMLPPPSRSVVSGTGPSSLRSGSGTMAASTSTLPSAPAKTYLPDYDVRDVLAKAVEPDESVLLISREPGQDFALDDSTTEHSSPLR